MTVQVHRGGNNSHIILAPCNDYIYLLFFCAVHIFLHSILSLARIADKLKQHTKVQTCTCRSSLLGRTSRDGTPRSSCTVRFVFVTAPRTDKHEKHILLAKIDSKMTQVLIEGSCFVKHFRHLIMSWVGNQSAIRF